MALDLTGIENRGEFYSPHYLDALLESDLKPLLDRWAAAEQGTPPVRAPHKRLAGLAGPWFSARAVASVLPPTALDERFDAVRDVHARLLEALGYPRTPGLVRLDDGTLVPLAHEERRGGRAYLWVLQAPLQGDADGDPLEQPPLACQVPEGEGEVTPLTWRALLDGPLFRHDDAPDWVVALAGGEVVLTHRHKWPRGKALVFDLDALFARREGSALKAMAALLHRDAVAPTDGTCLHEHLDENSHKHAFAVSVDLREGAQQAIEILGNEAIHDLLHRQKVRVFGTDDAPGVVDAEALTRECLVWLYRLIFLFYVESRDDLELVPMKSEAYRRGYSLESLRALEAVPLTTPQAQEGTYFDTSLRKLFALVARGHGRVQEDLLSAFDRAGFRLPGFQGRLFDDAQTPLLAKVRFRNAALQKVIALLSLSRERRREGRGRISYAQLGINQLGAVYEGLLSYTGFFARTDLCEVCNAGENGRPDAKTWFVPDDEHDRFDDAELVRGPDGARVVHRKGTFLFRLAGRDREKSASYYTPEVLTRCLVKHTLAERLGEGEGRLPADAILDLTVCEPAMGSGAFLSEAVSQLAEAYLQRKQEETGLAIPADRYVHELQRVKHRIAAHGCYGVDLNPLAAELGRVSLWLHVIRPGVPAPFFDARLVTGNSLVGARRQGYRLEQLVKAGRKGGDSWLQSAPEDIGASREDDVVYHWLLPAEGMAAFDGDKVVKDLLPDRVKVVRAWRRSSNAAWKPADELRLLKLSEAVDRLWDEHAQARREALAAVDQRLPVWPEPEPEGGADLSETYLAEVWARHEARDTAGRRLKEAMDLWCALWFWPVQHAELLPTRAEWLDDLETLLTGRPRLDLDTATDRQARRLRLARDVARRQRFLHWEWQFPEVFARGGFDVVVGNPPWIRVEWNEGGVLSDLDPMLVIRRLSAKQMADRRAEVLKDEAALGTYLAEFESLTGSKEFLNSVANYPLLQGVKTNLYKAFLVLSTRLVAHGAAGIIHQKGVYDDPRGGALRRHLIERLRLRMHFLNKLMLFEGITDKQHYEFTVLGTRTRVKARMISNVIHPRTLDESIVHDGQGEIPNIQDQEGKWDLRGHRSRIVEVDQATLALFAKLYDPPGTPALEARLPVVHSKEILEVLRKIARAPRKLGDLDGQYFTSQHWNETLQQQDGTIRRETRFPADASEWVVSGPHFYVGTPINKTPNEDCRHNQDYSVLDLMTLPDDYLPRTNYVPAVDRAEYVRRTPTWNGVSVTRFYRHIHREMVAPTGERTLAPCILSRDAGHVHTVFSIAFRSNANLALFNGFASSLVADFFAKSTGAGHMNIAITSMLPMPNRMEPAFIARALRLNCLTTHYADLWAELYDPSFRADGFTKADPRLDDWSHLGPTWTRDTPLRSPFARRQALVELDALAALALGLTADELCLIYRVQFPVLQQYEADTWYDRRGRIVFTANRGLTGVGLDRKQWEEVRHAAPGDALPAWAVDALGPYEPPFDRCDREADMRQAYEAFRARHEGVSVTATPVPVATVQRDV